MTLIVERKRRRVEDEANAVAQRGLDSSAKARAEAKAEEVVTILKAYMGPRYYPLLVAAVLKRLGGEPVKLARTKPVDPAKALREKVFSGGAK